MVPQPLSRKQRRKLRYGPGGKVRFVDEHGKIGIIEATKAHEYEQEGRAAFDANGILVFLPENHRHIAAQASAKRRPRYVNGDGFASIEAIAGLPCIQPLRLLTGHRPASPPVDIVTVLLSTKANPIQLEDERERREAAAARAARLWNAA